MYGASERADKTRHLEDRNRSKEAWWTVNVADVLELDTADNSAGYRKGSLT
jgi:hypothetical protein